MNQSSQEPGRAPQLRRLLALQGVVVIFSLSGVFIKLASNSWSAQGLFHIQTLFFICCYGLLLMVYAFFWQKMIARVRLSTAYLNKSFSVVWSLLFAVLIFHESVTAANLIGAVVILCGILLVSAHA